MTTPFNLRIDELDEIVQSSLPIWEKLRGEHILVTGGTGFFGRWLADSFARANATLDLRAHLTLIARTPPSATITDASIELRAADVTQLPHDFGKFDRIIHAATASCNPSGPAETVATVVDGTRRVLDLAEACVARSMVFVSSGAIYGKHAPLGVVEDSPYGPDTTAPAAAYGESKRLAEMLCAIAAAERGVNVTIARGFTFVGPYMPIDAHFAIGNFIRDGLAGGPIHVSGDGTPIRSYMYAADIARWLWTMLVEGKPGRAYNLGSPAPVTIADLARTVASRFDPASEVVIASQSPTTVNANVFVPSTIRAESELGLHCLVSLPDAIDRTIRWHLR